MCHMLNQFHLQTDIHKFAYIFETHFKGISTLAVLISAHPYDGILKIINLILINIFQFGKFKTLDVYITLED